MKHLVDVFKDRCRKDADKTAFLVRQQGKWHPVSWAEADARSDQIAAGLLALGIEPGSAVCILGNTRLEWTLSDLGALKSGCISIGIYQTLSGEQAAYILKDSKAKCLFVEDQSQIDKIAPHLPDLPGLKWIVGWDGAVKGSNVIAFKEFLSKGRAALDADPQCLNQIETKINPDDVAIIIYTSGTTGPPKGACLTHKNFIAELKATDVVPQKDIGDIMMFFLPLSHVGERVAQYLRIRRGISAAYVQDIKKILDDIKEIRPTFFGSVPRIFEKAYARVRSQVESAPPSKQKIFYWSERVGREVSRNIQAGRDIPLWLRLKYNLADFLVLKKIREVFGGRVRYFLSSAAPIALEIIEFFHACGMVILEGYGQTEVSCFCTLNMPEAFRFGSVGRALPDVELKIADDGEIMVKGDIVFKGYHNQPELTQKTLTRDGWIYTGDIGRIDSDGFLWITGRKKDIIITSGGKNVTPSNIENLLMNHPLIEYAMVHGDRRKFLTALISLSAENLPAWAEANGFMGLHYEQITGLDAVKQEIQKAVNETNKHLANFETIKKFIILPKPFDIETGELTPTMKVRRNIVEQRYMNMLDELYMN
ncbi:MAG: long-chain fatty acid--CoA ligase [Desulfobacterales bacterium]|jgi:long-chain acyl-CoA synthetase|nr:long-chain fatty acid--CoA ligase [Desulfobacterales bacterium]